MGHRRRVPRGKPPGGQKYLTFRKTHAGVQYEVHYSPRGAMVPYTVYTRSPRGQLRKLHPKKVPEVVWAALIEHLEEDREMSQMHARLTAEGRI